MAEREPRKETIGQGELFFLYHPGTENTFSGYGLSMQPGSKELLVGLLIVDRPHPADVDWLKQVEATFGQVQLVQMTAAGERGIVCQMEIGPESLPHLRQFPGEKVDAIRSALKPLLDELPDPVLRLSWNEDVNAWQSRLAPQSELPAEIRDVFERFGHGCLAVETNVGVSHICHATDTDIEAFRNKPVWKQWQLIKMPTAPLIRLELVILDDPTNPYKFESFLNIADEEQGQILAQLANQDELYLAFYGDDLRYRYTKVIEHDKQQWQQLDELVDEANRHWDSIPTEQQDFDLAKAEFIRRYI